MKYPEKALAELSDHLIPFLEKTAKKNGINTIGEQSALLLTFAIGLIRSDLEVMSRNENDYELKKALTIEIINNFSYGEKEDGKNDH